MVRFISAALLAVTLAGCAQQDLALYTTGRSLSTAQAGALKYLGQPPCPPGQKAITCVDPATKASIKQASDDATKTFDAAYDANAAGGSPKLVAAAGAIALLTALIPH